MSCKVCNDLDVWKESRKLVKLIYDLTKDFPKEETYGLTSQIRRCAVSIPSNIAEGCSRNHTKIQFNFSILAEVLCLN
jgi:four helix bundle protein